MNDHNNQLEFVANGELYFGDNIEEQIGSITRTLIFYPRRTNTKIWGAKDFVFGNTFPVSDASDELTGDEKFVATGTFDDVIIEDVIAKEALLKSLTYEPTD